MDTFHCKLNLQPAQGTSPLPAAYRGNGVITLKETNVIVKKNTIQNVLKHEGQPVVKYRIEYPQFAGGRYQLTLVLMNRFYQAQAEKYKRYLEGEFFDQAVKQYENAVENGFPAQVYEAIQTYQVTYRANCIVSLFMDRYEYTAGAHGNTVESSQTWNLQKYTMLRLRDLFACGKDQTGWIFKQIEKQIAKEPDIYFEDYKKLIRETFRPEQFYCTPEGVVIYYQQYDIAPYSSGIRKFLIPYTDCLADPKKTCFAGA